jgi:hypothetical protein
MAYSKAKLKSSGGKTAPCFRSFWMEKLSEKFSIDTEVIHTLPLPFARCQEMAYFICENGVGVLQKIYDI